METESIDLTRVQWCAAANLRKAARAVTQLYDEALRPADLRVTQFSLLATLAQRGESPVSELADAVTMDRTTLTRNLGPLERRGLVAIVPGTDRRERLVSLTADGYGVLEQARPLWVKAQATLTGELGDDAARSLLGLLSRAVRVTQER
jgi:DNA-binding MarR family transcriptional regulator